MTPQISVTLVTYNAEPFLKACLDSISNALAGIPHEIIIVDNASTDQTVSLLRNQFHGVTLLENKSNLGFAKAMNLAMQKANAPYLLWINPDAQVLDGSAAEILDYMEAHPKIGIAGLQILNPDKTIQLSCRSFPSYQTALFNRYSLLSRLFPKNPLSRKYLKSDWDHQSIQETDWVSGACLILRRKTLEDVGPLDEHFFMYCEDVDFCRRAWTSGWQVVYHPGVKILHHIAGSSRHLKRRMLVEHHRSMWHYYLKYHKRNIFLDIAVAGGILLRCFMKVLFPPKTD